MPQSHVHYGVGRILTLQTHGISWYFPQEARCILKLMKRFLVHAPIYLVTYPTDVPNQTSGEMKGPLVCAVPGTICPCPILCSLLQSWPLEPASPLLPRPPALCCTWPKEGRRQGFPGGAVVKSLPANAGDMGDVGVRKIPWNRTWQPAPVFLPGKLHGQRSLVGYSPWDHKESDMTEQLTYTHIHFFFIYFY